MTLGSLHTCWFPHLEDGSLWSTWEHNRFPGTSCAGREPSRSEPYNRHRLLNISLTIFFMYYQTIDLSTARTPVLVFIIYASLASILIIIWKPYRSIIILPTNYRTRRWWQRFAKVWLTSEYNRWPDKAGPSRCHFGRAVDRSIEKWAVQERVVSVLWLPWAIADRTFFPDRGRGLRKTLHKLPC